MTATTPNIREIFDRALEIASESERAAYLDETCTGAPEIRQQVAALLAAHAAAGSFLETPPSAVAANAAPTTDQPSPERPGTQIGPYKLLQQIGEGGMGVVYMAEQEQPVRRRVALKIIKPGMDTRQVIARFEAERHALSLMDHPNIAKVLDAGTTDSGRPYFVMELVKGQPITQYCDEHHLTPRQRLELLLPVCQAIQHAHQKGIIHRDIKPTNILVAEYDSQPVPKVIDFGVAKATSQALTEKTMFTGFGQIVGTLEYMSPEQAKVNQLDIDTRSDIYSLGVLLYELLTGSTPFDKQRLRSAAFDEMLRIIREEEPEKPSTRLSRVGSAHHPDAHVAEVGIAHPTLASIAAVRGTEPARLSKLVRGELDWIVMKALEKDRNRRYETATGFAKDIEHYLNDEQVLACPPSAMYRFRKFARRNKSAMAVVGLILFFITLLGSGVGWAVRDRSAREAEAARQQAERQAKVAGQVESILAEVDLLEHEQKWPEALAAARRAKAAVAGGEADPALHDQVRQVLADLEMVRRLEELRVEAMVGRLVLEERATAHRKYAEAFQEYGIDVEKLPNEEAAQRIRSRLGIAPVLTAALDFWAFVRGDDDAESRRLIAVAQAADPDPWRQRVRDSLLRKDWQSLSQLAVSDEMLRQPPATLFLLGLALHDRGNREGEGEAVLRQAQRQYPNDFWINHILGLWLASKNGPHIEEAIGFMRVAVAVGPHFPAAIRNLGANLVKLERLDEAIACFRKAIELDGKQANVHHALGTALAKQKKLDEAIACYRKAIELDPKFAFSHNNLGVALAAQRKLDEAIACYRKAIELDPKYAVAHGNLGNTLAQKGQAEEAIVSWREAITLQPNLPAIHYHYARALTKAGNVDGAIAAYRKILELWPNAAEPHNNLAWLLATATETKLRDPAQAVVLAGKAVEFDPDNAAYPNTLGVAHYRAGNWKAALTALDKSLELRKGGDSFDWFFLAMAHWQLGETEKAREWYDRAVQWTEENKPNHEELRRFWVEAAELLKIEVEPAQPEIR